MSAPVEHYLRIWLGRRKSAIGKNFSQAKIAEIDSLLVALKNQTLGNQIQTKQEENEVHFIEASTGKVIASISYNDANA
jgi:hypothetical protein